MAVTEVLTLYTQRLVLRPLSLADAPAIVALAGEWDIAFNTLSIPHPYRTDHAVQWIRQQAEQWEQKQPVNFAIARPDSALIGSIGLDIVPSFNLAELGYWIGRELNPPSQYLHSTAFPLTGATVESTRLRFAGTLWPVALVKAGGE